MNKNLKSLALFLTTVLSACGQQTFDQKMNQLYRGTVPLIRSDELKNTNEVVILDTRQQVEYETSHIDGARFVDYDEFNESMVGDLSKDQEIVVYCSVGYRSERIGEKLQKLGFTNVRNLYGGIFDWKNTGNSVYNKNNELTDSVHTYNARWSKWLYKGIKVYD